MKDSVRVMLSGNDDRDYRLETVVVCHAENPGALQDFFPFTGSL